MLRAGRRVYLERGSCPICFSYCSIPLGPNRSTTGVVLPKPKPKQQQQQEQGRQRLVSRSFPTPWLIQSPWLSITSTVAFNHVRFPGRGFQSPAPAPAPASSSIACRVQDCLVENEATTAITVRNYLLITFNDLRCSEPYLPTVTHLASWR